MCDSSKGTLLTRLAKLLVPVEGLTEEALKYGEYSQLQLDDSHKLQYLQIISFTGPIHVSPLINAVLKDVMLIAK
jgi:hypothetical protein